MKNKPRKDSRRHAFESQKQRSRCCIRSRKTCHEQQRADNAARHNGTCEPRHICSIKRRLDCRAGHQQWLRDPPQDRNADARAAIEQAREHRRIDGPEKGFGSRRRNAEESSGQEGEDDSVAVHERRIADRRLGGQHGEPKSN